MINQVKENSKKVPLGTLAEFRNGVNFTKANFGRGIKVINVKDFKDRLKPSYEELGEINPDGVVGSNDLLKEDDIVFVRSNGNRQLIGRSLLIKGAGTPLTHSAFTIRARFRSSEVFPLFYAYVLRSQIVRDALSAFGGGTNINNLNQDILSRLLVPFPSLSTQRRVAEILSDFDQLIENNTRRIKILEEMAQSLYREWFVHFRFVGHETANFEQSGSEKIPQGWKVCNIGEVVETLGGGTPSTTIPEYWEGGQVIWFTPSDLTASRTMFIATSTKKISSLGLEKSSARLFPPHSVMMTSRATIGVVAINTNLACTNQGFVTCIPNDLVSAFQLYFWMLDNKEKIVGIASGATYKEINRTEFRDLPILVAETGANKKFVEVVRPICNQIENLQAKNSNLRGTRDLLLPKLVSGEVEIRL
jgi:type I restriction enzyme S subunit